MKEDFKKWLCELAGFHYDDYKPGGSYYWSHWDVQILVKAMWAINRDARQSKKKIINIIKVTINIDFLGVYVWDNRNVKDKNNFSKHFLYSNYNDSEIKTLEACLQYIFNNKGMR